MCMHVCLCAGICLCMGMCLCEEPSKSEEDSGGLSSQVVESPVTPHTTWVLGTEVWSSGGAVSELTVPSLQPWTRSSDITSLKDGAGHGTHAYHSSTGAWGRTEEFQTRLGLHRATCPNKCTRKQHLTERNWFLFFRSYFPLFLLFLKTWFLCVSLVFLELAL